MKILIVEDEPQVAEISPSPRPRRSPGHDRHLGGAGALTVVLRSRPLFLDVSMPGMMASTSWPRSAPRPALPVVVITGTRRPTTSSRSRRWARFD